MEVHILTEISQRVERCSEREMLRFSTKTAAQKREQQALEGIGASMHCSGRLMRLLSPVTRSSSVSR